MLAVEVRDQSQVAEARRLAAALAARCGCGATSTGRVALVATELATNLLKHGGGGELLLSPYQAADSAGIQLLALDKGRGMRDLQACLGDGYSTAGSAGRGLGAVQRQSESFEVASWPELGTVVLSRVSTAETFTVPTAAMQSWGHVSVAKPGEEVCGDAQSVVDWRNGRALMVADGLGHGPEAAIAATEAVRLFQRHGERPITEVLALMHDGLRPTRGAAVAIARIDAAQARVSYGGIGNIVGSIVSGGHLRHMISMNGTLGHNARKVQSFDYACPAGSLVVMHSDGLSPSWSLGKYPGLAQRDPTVIAAVLYRDQARRRDDATVLVARAA